MCMKMTIVVDKPECKKHSRNHVPESVLFQNLENSCSVFPCFLQILVAKSVHLGISLWHFVAENFPRTFLRIVEGPSARSKTT
jgi:hypothetical protein